MTLPTIDPIAAKRLIDDGAVLIDIREVDEFARERVPGARNKPLRASPVSSRPLSRWSRKFSRRPSR